MSQPLKDSQSDSADDLANTVARDVRRLVGEPLAPGLYLVATPIGNLGDITLRALSVLARADVIYCEDTRHSARLLQHFLLRATTRAFHEHNEEAELKRVMNEVAGGKRIALISDAGTPLVSDPGFKLVRAAAGAGQPLTAVPGPSAVIGALSLSGLPTDAFMFAGFLPAKKAARRARIADLKLVPGTLIFFEAPQRVGEALADLAEVLGDRPAAMARELTKLHEEVARGSLATLASAIGQRELKGEVVLVVGPPPVTSATDEEIIRRLAVALQTMPLKEAAKAVADALSVPKSRVYDLGLKVKDESR